MIIGYINHLGNKQLLNAQKNFYKNNPNQKIELLSATYPELINLLNKGKIDAAVVNKRTTDYAFKYTLSLGKSAVVAIIQKEIFDSHAQIVELSDLKANACLLICDKDEEKSEYGYYRNVLHIDNQFLAVNSLNEAILMAQAGSGFFLMNEYNMDAVKNDNLQKLFLFDKQKQVSEEFVLLAKQKSSNLNKFYEDLKAAFK